MPASLPRQRDLLVTQARVPEDLLVEAVVDLGVPSIRARRPPQQIRQAALERRLLAVWLVGKSRADSVVDRPHARIGSTPRGGVGENFDRTPPVPALEEQLPEEPHRPRIAGSQLERSENG